MLTVLMQPQVSVAQVEITKTASEVSLAPEIRVVAGEDSGPQLDPFRQLLDRAIETTSKRTLTANSHSPWQIFHCILALRQETVLRLDGQKVNAIQWLSTTEPQFDKKPWLMLTPHGAKFHPYTRIYAFEGHPSQFLALLSHSNLPLDFEFHVQGKVVTLNDLVNNTMKEVNTKEEVTWVLWALQHFLKSDATWTNQANEPWSIERLVQMEANAPVVNAPCGGNHRLFALTRARDKYLTSGGQLRGAWFQADQKIKQHIEIARSLQNSDGSFSNDSYKGPGHTTDVNKRFNTTGHTMEFLAVSLPKERLHEPWVRNAVWMLSRELIIHRDTKIDCGPLFHTLDALILYRERIRAGEGPTEMIVPPETLATQPPASSVENDQKSERVAKDSPKPSKPVREPKSVAQTPDDVKQSSPELKSVPVPIPESTVTPELKGDEPKFDPPSLSVPQASIKKISLPKSVASKVGSPHSESPKIDPSKLANVGQVADPRQAGTSPRMARRERTSTTPPALLPDLSATPLFARNGPESTLTLQPGSLVIDAHQGLKDCGNGVDLSESNSSVPLLVETPPASQDEPVSALQPVNQ